MEKAMCIYMDGCNILAEILLRYSNLCSRSLMMSAAVVIIQKWNISNFSPETPEAHSYVVPFIAGSAWKPRDRRGNS